MPLIVFLIMMILLIGVFCDENKNSNKEIMKIMFFKSRSKFKILYNLLAVFLWVLYVIVAIIVSLIFILIFIIPIYISVVFVFFRMMYWWNKKRRIEVAQKNASDSKDNSFKRMNSGK